MRAPCSLATLLFATACLITSAAAAVELPIRGEFGDPESNGCASLRAEEEGAYVGFNEGGQTGENGEGGCNYRQVAPLGKNKYRLIGTCKSLEGKPQKVSKTLTVIDKDQIMYDGTRYTRCR